MKEEILRAISKLKKSIYEPQEQGDSPHKTTINVGRVFDKIDKWGEELQEQLDRLEGCGYCNDNDVIAECFIEQEKMLLTGDFTSYDDRYLLSIRGENILQLISEDEQCIDSAKIKEKINYCPNCGRKLK